MASTKRTTEAQDQILEAVRQSQAAVVDGLRSWTETVQQLVPARTSWSLADQLPTPAEAVDSVYDFAAQLLKLQREFAHSLIGVTAPLVERTRQEAEKPVQRTTKAA